VEAFRQKRSASVPIAARLHVRAQRGACTDASGFVQGGADVQTNAVKPTVK
jgi:hypothetical protein